MGRRAGAIGQGVLFFLPELGLIERGSLADIISKVLGMVFPLSIAVAILRYRMFDIDRIINRAIVYGILTTALAAIYFGGVFLTQEIFRSVTNRESQVAIVISTLAMAALFNPLRRRIQAFIDSRFYRTKYDAAQTLAAFRSQLRDEVDLDQLSESLTAVVSETIQPEYLSLWLREPGSQSREAIPPPRQ